jgi:UDP-N-acetylenolpyruvoylglucosamine reductase
MSLAEDRRDRLLSLGLASVRFDVSVAPWTALGIGGPVDVLLEEGDEESMRLLRRWCRRERLPAAAVPGGPQILVRDGGIKGVVIVPGGPPRSQPRRARLFLDPKFPTTAAQMLRDCGAAGIRLRGVRIDASDPNVIINEANAKAHDVVALQAWLRDQVYTRTGVGLESALTLVGIARKP